DRAVSNLTFLPLWWCGKKSSLLLVFFCLVFRRPNTTTPSNQPVSPFTSWSSWLVKQTAASCEDDDELASVFAEELSLFRDRFHFDDFSKRADCFCRQYLYARALRLITEDWDAKTNRPKGEAFFRNWPGYDRLEGLEHMAIRHMISILQGFLCVSVLSSLTLCGTEISNLKPSIHGDGGGAKTSVCFRYMDMSIFIFRCVQIMSRADLDSSSSSSSQSIEADILHCFGPLSLYLIH